MTSVGTKIYQKSVEIQAWTSKTPLLCSPVSQNRPRVPQDAEVKPPIMPNDRLASQKHQDPLATMLRISNPEAMSNDRGPAAEGVAHKIKSAGPSKRGHQAAEDLLDLSPASSVVMRACYSLDFSYFRNLHPAFSYPFIPA